MKNTLTLAILFICIKTGSMLLSQKPQDFVTAAGKKAYFNCSTSDPSKPILWYHYPTNKAHREPIYQFANFTDYWYPCYRKGRYVVERNPVTGAYNLVIPSVLLSDAGRYLCDVGEDEGMATLTVQVESNPVCVPSEICKPYIKQYSTAIICIILIILPIAIGGTIFVMRCILVYRSKKRKQKEETEQLMHTTNTHISKIQELESELKQKDIKVNTLEAKVKHLEQLLYPTGNIDYTENPTSQTDADKEQREPINGMTILGKELFVSHESSSVIEVYDSDTFKFGRNLAIDGMAHPMDIASCKISNCIYIIFRGDSESGSHIMKLGPNGQLKKEWPTGGEHGRLSTCESNVIVCLFEKQMIKEFSGYGNLIHRVRLSPAIGFSHPWHAIKVTSNHFVVCHGDAKEELHHVCKVDVQGRIVKDSRDWESKQTDGNQNFPICLAEDIEGSILVADRDCKAIRLLNCDLKLQRNLIRKESLEGHPVRICLDETKRQLYVATNNLVMQEWKHGRYIKFNIFCQ